MLLTDLAEDLAARGHEVHVLTSRQLYGEPRARLPVSEERRGIHIHRLYSTAFGRGTFWGRFADIATFRYALSRVGTKLPGPDAWFVMTDPPLVLETVLSLRHRLGGALVHQVADLYPDLAVGLGTLPADRLMTGRLYARSRRAMLQCDRVLAPGECMAEVLACKGVNSGRLQVTPPWADGDMLRPLPHRENAFRMQLGLSENDFLVMYSGNMGKGHRFETILEAARLLQDDQQVYFAFVGDGDRRDQISVFCRNHGLQRVLLLPYQPRGKLRQTLSAADVHLISLDPRVQGLMVPSKLAAVLAVGRPVLFVGDRENSVARAILRNECGRVVSEGQPQEIVDILDQVKRGDRVYQEMKRRARALFERDYARRVVVSRIISIMEKTVGGFPVRGKSKNRGFPLKSCGNDRTGGMDSC
jgi:colanic acid biosynthesis glycosyl transferase WcaI